MLCESGCENEEECERKNNDCQLEGSDCFECACEFGIGLNHLLFVWEMFVIVH